MKKIVTTMTVVLAVGLAAPAMADALGEHYSLGEFHDAIRELERAAPELVEVTEYGKSVEGRPLLAARIARDDGRERPEVLITGCVHANEWTGARVALSIARRLAEDDGEDPWITSLLDRMEFYVLPLQNPDGYAAAEKHLKTGFTMRRDNENHVDLNRNWPYPDTAEIDSARGRMLGGSNFKYSPNYRGPYPLSEPENAAMNEFVAGRDFFLNIDFHTTGGRFSYVWSYKADPPEHEDVFKAMGEALTSRQGTAKYQVHQSYEWYQIIGSSKDWYYGRHGILAATIEVGQGLRKKAGIYGLNPFYWYNDRDVDVWIENDRDATLHAIETAYEMTGGEPAAPRDFEWVLPPGMEQPDRLQYPVRGEE